MYLPVDTYGAVSELYAHDGAQCAAQYHLSRVSSPSTARQLGLRAGIAYNIQI